MKKIFNCLLSLLIICLSCCSFIACSLIEKPEAPLIDAEVTYVSLGDSIAEGYSLDGYSAKDENGFVVGSYTHSFKTKLEKKYRVVHATNYATTGHTSGNLLSLLTPLTSNELNSTQLQMKNNIQQADIITICIGANDILAPAQSNLINYLMSNTDITPFLDDGLQTLSTNFPLIVSTLKELNSTANLVFLNVYNPYKDLISTSHQISIPPAVTLTSEKLNEIGSITEAYLDSGTFTINGSSKTVTNGVNQIISNNILNQPNCHLLNVKSDFDLYYTTTAKYDVVIADILSKPTLLISAIVSAIDPHPSALGHQRIFNLLNSWADSNTIK